MRKDVDEKSPARHLSNQKCELKKESNVCQFKFKDQTYTYQSASLMEYK